VKRDRDEYNEYVSNPDGVYRVKSDFEKQSYSNEKKSFVQEDSSKSYKEAVRVEEIKKANEPSSFQRPKIRKPELSLSVNHAIAAVGSTVGSVAVAAVVVAVAVVMAFSITISLVSATDTSLSFYVSIEENDGKTFTAYLSQGENVYTQGFTDSGYITFSDLSPDSEYTLKVLDDESGQEYFNQNFRTASPFENSAAISNVVYDAETKRVSFVLSVDLRKEEFYNIQVVEEGGNVLLNVDDTTPTQEFSVVHSGAAIFAKVSVNGRTLLFEELKFEIPAEYEYGEPVFEWTELQDGGYTAVAVFTATNADDVVERVDATVTSTETAATCEEQGQITYTAVATFGGNNYQDKKIDSIDALGHAYGEPEWQWNELQDGGYSGVIATFTCQNDPAHTEQIEAELTNEYIAPTCDQDGKTVYTATVTFAGQEYNDTREIVSGVATGHSYSADPVFEWTETNDGWTAQAVFTCSVCGEEMRMDAEMNFEQYDPDCETDGYIIYYANVEYEGEPYEDEKEVTIPATGHNFTAAFEWEQDFVGAYTGATVTLTCQNNAEHVVGNLVATVTEKVEEDEMGAPVRTVYTATLEYDGKTYTDTKTVEN